MRQKNQSIMGLVLLFSILLILTSCGGRRPPTNNPGAPELKPPIREIVAPNPPPGEGLLDPSEGRRWGTIGEALEEIDIDIPPTPTPIRIYLPAPTPIFRDCDPFDGVYVVEYCG